MMMSSKSEGRWSNVAMHWPAGVCVGFFLQPYTVSLCSTACMLCAHCRVVSYTVVLLCRALTLLAAAGARGDVCAGDGGTAAGHGRGGVHAEHPGLHRRQAGGCHRAPLPRHAAGALSAVVGLRDFVAEMHMAWLAFLVKSSVIFIPPGFVPCVP